MKLIVRTSTSHPSGTEIEVSNETLVKDLCKAVSKVSNSFMNDKPHKAVLVRNESGPLLLENESSIWNAGANDYDVVLLLPVRSCPHIRDPVNEPAPHLQQINFAIQNECQSRKAKGLSVPPSDPRAASNVPARSRWLVEANPTYLSRLVAIGFDEGSAWQALVATRNNLELAANSLLNATTTNELGQETRPNPEPVSSNSLHEASSSRSMAADEFVESLMRDGLSRERLQTALEELNGNPEVMRTVMSHPEIGPLLRTMIMSNQDQAP